MRSSNKSAAVRHAAEIVASRPSGRAEPAAVLRQKVKVLLGNVLDALEQRRLKRLAPMLQANEQYLDAIPDMTADELRAVQSAIAIYKASTAETAEANALPAVSFAAVDGATIRKLLEAPIREAIQLPLSLGRPAERTAP